MFFKLKQNDISGNLLSTLTDFYTTTVYPWPIIIFDLYIYIYTIEILGHWNNELLVSRASLTSWVEGASLATKRLLHREVKILPSFSAMFARGSSSLQLFPVVWILLRSLGVICYDRWVLSEGQGSLSHELTACLFFNLFKLNELWPCSKACRPDSFEWRNFLKLSFSNIWGLRSNFVDCESFIESNSLESNSCSPWDKPGWPWFSQFFSERLSSFNPKGF